MGSCSTKSLHPVTMVGVTGPPPSLILLFLCTVYLYAGGNICLLDHTVCQVG